MPRAKYTQLLQAEKDIAIAETMLSGSAPLENYIETLSPDFGPPDWARKSIIPAFEACRQAPQRICISVPPRHGKSYSVMHALAKWIKDFPRDTCAYATYNATKGRSKSKIIRNFARRSGVEFDPSMANLDEWRTTAGGGLLAGGLSGGGLVGEGIQGILCVDDPIPTAKKAESKSYRNEIYDNFQAVAMTRMEGGSVIVIQCMTGDTPVLMATGEEKHLRDIRPGDRVATYDDGKVSVSTVENWINNGPDKVFEIRMKSGTVVKANARHPFLVEEGGKTKWVRTAQLKKGESILSVGGASGKGLSASNQAAPSQSPVRPGASHITAKSAGRRAIGLLRETLKISARGTCGIATASTSQTSSEFLMSREECAQSASNLQRKRTHEPTGTTNSASTIATTAARLGAFFATIAISLLAMARRKRRCSQPLSTYEIVRDTVVEVVEAGVEDVFDVQIDRTENFIANGLVSHNTRWHDDDLIGRLEKDGGWTIINLPAIAEANDPLGREVGAPLDPIRYPLELEDSSKALGALNNIQPREPVQDDDGNIIVEGKIGIGAYMWSALYQGQPRAKGQKIFGAPFYYDPDEFTIKGCRVVMGVDPAASEKTSADHSAAVVMAMEGDWDDPTFYILHVWRGQVQIPDLVSILHAKQTKYHDAHVIVEAVSGFKGVAQTLKRLDKRLKVYETAPRENKFMRAQPFAAAWNAGKVLVPTGAPWLADFYDELDRFTGVDDAEDDQVDAGAHAFNVYDAARPPERGSRPAP